MQSGPVAAVGVVGIAVAAVGVLAVEAAVARRGSAPGPVFGLEGDGPGPRLAWLGDSTAAGVGCSGPSGTLPAQAAYRLGMAPAGTSVLAISGARVADVLSDQVPRLGPAAPDAVLISVGANDAVHLTARRAFRARYQAVTDALVGTFPATPIVLLGVPDLGAPPRLAQPLRAVAGWRGRCIDAEVRRVATATGAWYVDIAGPTGPRFRRHPGRYFADDRYHPNDAGYGLWADALAAQLRRAGLDLSGGGAVPVPPPSGCV